MKRKIILGLVSIVLCVSMVGCGATSTDAPSSSSGSAFATETPTDAPTDAPTEAPQEHVNIETNDKETETDEKDSSVITFDEMLDSMVAEYGEVEFIPVFAERNFEDTITHLETQLRPTEHSVISVNVDKYGYIMSYTTNSGEFYYGEAIGLYVPMTYDGENFYVTYPEVLIHGTTTPFEAPDDIPYAYAPGEPLKSYARYGVDGSNRLATITTRLIVDGIGIGFSTYPFEVWGYEFGENVCHFTYEGESYIFLYITNDKDMCKGIILKDTGYTKDKTIDKISETGYLGYPNY